MAQEGHIYIKIYDFRVSRRIARLYDIPGSFGWLSCKRQTHEGIRHSVLHMDLVPVYDLLVMVPVEVEVAVAAMTSLAMPWTLAIHFHVTYSYKHSYSNICIISRCVGFSYESMKGRKILGNTNLNIAKY